jgi:hypothetical protein
LNPAGPRSRMPSEALAKEGESHAKDKCRLALTSIYDSAISPPVFARGLPSMSRSLKIRGRREDRVRAAPAVSRARLGKETHTSIQVQRRQSGLPCAMVLRLITCSPRRPGFLATVASRAFTQSLTPASGRQDHTISPSASASFVQQRIRVHRIPCRVDDVGQRPSVARDGRPNASDLPDGTSEIFFAEGLDVKQPAGQITRPIDAFARYRAFLRRRVATRSPCRIADRQSRDSGFARRAPRNDIPTKTRRDCSRRVPTFVLAGPGAENALCQAQEALAGDPSEVTALGKRHWITSFRC